MPPMLVTFDSQSHKLTGKNSSNSSKKYKKLRSRQGCLTCKARKKKCDELKPTCTTCFRLGKPCVWVDVNCMSKEEICLIRDSVKEQERVTKLRRRRPKEAIASARVSNLSVNVETSYKQGKCLLKDFLHQPEMKLAPAISDYTTSYPIGRSESCIPVAIDQGNEGFMHEILLPVDPDPRRGSVKLSRQILNNGDQTWLMSRETDPILDQSVNFKKSHVLPAVDNLGEDNIFELPRCDSVISLSSSDSILNGMKHDEFLRLNASKQAIPLDMGQVLASPQFSVLMSSADFSDFELGEQSWPKLVLSNDEDPIQAGLNYLHNKFQNVLSPLPPVQPLIIPELTNTNWSYLYDIYVTNLSNRVTVLPSSLRTEFNWYRSVFLPLAEKDKGVLYSILAWLAFSMGEDWVAEGSRLVLLALNHIKQTSEFNGSSDGDVVSKSVVFRLATFILLYSAKICHGDVLEWSVYLKWAARLIRKHGGIQNFGLLVQESWLVSNFAYHDLMSSGCANKRGMLFSQNDYYAVFSSKLTGHRGQMNPLFGVSRCMYHILGRINHFIYVSRHPEMTFFDSSDILGRDLTEICYSLDTEILQANPDEEYLAYMTPNEQKEHVMLFRVFQLSIRLLLMQSILKYCPSTDIVQIINKDLIECIDNLLGTTVQALLVFPIFICAIHCYTWADREAMRARIDRYILLYAPWNVRNVRFLVERIWGMNEFGALYIDWLAVLEELGWEINFA